MEPDEKRVIEQLATVTVIISLTLAAYVLTMLCLTIAH